MAGTDDITNDDIESRQVMLLEVEQRSSAILREKNDLERRADKVISELSNNILFLFAFMGGISIYLTIKIPTATAFAISILLMCLFLAGTFILVGMAKSRITLMNAFIQGFTEKYKKVREDATILMELEQNRKRWLAANVVDNSEGLVMSMDFFIDRAKNISDAIDFSDFEKHYYKLINLSWVLGGIYIPVVLVLSYFNYYYGQDSSSLDEARSTWSSGCCLFKNYQYGALLSA
ncbi:uncharacterized protein [Nicotiana tomentosiformis]|uniref:uncharacterized protein n=1 Tax=Nicotiana tomentosiformis TaxID=4098 RepID=UPI00051BECF9|nr:uncharacterized protein LOC104086547 isoform X1 [Nicotiana tomentosiformis]